MRCLSCHQEGIDPSAENCPSCEMHLPTLMRDLLPAGYLLHGNKYELSYPLGRGGFGVTYLALHRALNKPVAIKEYFPDDISHRTLGSQTIQGGGERIESYRKGLQRFLREGRVLGQIQHPNVVKVEDFFAENNTAYLVMEFLKGHSLKQEMVAAGGKLSPERVKEVGSQLVAALAEVHSQGVFHLDLKPDNIVVEGNTIKLIDFGSARPEGGVAAHSTRSFTQRYAPIEVIANGEVGSFSDIFELGMILHELLTGAVPPEVMQRVMNPIWKPQGLPQEFQALLEQALQIQPFDRPQSVKTWWESLMGSGESEIDRLKRELAQAIATAEAERQRALAAEAERQRADSISQLVKNPANATQSAVSHPAIPKFQLTNTTERLQVASAYKNSLGMAFVLIQPGSFMMGSPISEVSRTADETQHQVTLSKAFYMQMTPLTQEQWETVMGDNPSFFKGDGNLPVESISWDECQEYIQKLNQMGEGLYRLPTEAEWEYACRAGTTGPFGVGDGYSLDASQANFDGNYPYGQGRKGEYRGRTSPVGSFQPNAWGLYDMHGNVFEWCQDSFSPYSTEAQTDPLIMDTGERRVIRGGCWSRDSGNCRSAYRFRNAQMNSYMGLGFRLMRHYTP